MLKAVEWFSLVLSRSALDALKIRGPGVRFPLWQFPDTTFRCYYRPATRRAFSRVPLRLLGTPYGRRQLRIGIDATCAAMSLNASRLAGSDMYSRSNRHSIK